jgi:UDP-N-acetyl-2-amino-2-deoxyglucuronate dehydrogenase
MVVAEKLDLVIVCTPHPNHRLAVDEALQSGAHVLVEKPLAANLADCDAMINTATACGRKLGVVSQRRFYAPVQRLKSAIDAGKIW